MDQAKFLGALDELFELDAGTVAPESVLMDLPGWSSLTFMGLIAIVDEEFGVTVSPAAVLKCSTVDDLCSLVASSLRCVAA